MDRRRVMGIGVAAALAGPGLADGARAQVMRDEPGYLPGDSTEFVPLWPGTPPGGEGVHQTPKVTDEIEPDGFHVRAIRQIQTPGFFVWRPANPNGLGLLIITGPLMVWLKFGGTEGFTAWFWAKMVLVVLLLVAVIYAGINANAAERGDMAAAKRAPMIGTVAMLLLLGVVLCAVFAFN